MTIKFLTLNVWHGGKLLEPMLDFLEHENPDILVLQEAYNESDSDLPANFHTVELIKKRLNYPHTDFAGEFRQIFPHHTAVRGNAMLSRFPITHRDTTFFNAPFNEHYLDISKNFPTVSHNLQHVALDTPGGEVNIFNYQGVWDLAGGNYSPARQRMTDVILEAIQGKPNVILAGDTNATPDNIAIKRLEEQLKNAFAGELTTTFNMRHKTNPGYATAVVDMMFVSKNILIHERSCPEVDVSDHLPLVATISI